MKYLLPLFILFAVSVSCKKKETNHPSDASVSKGDFLILVVSDSVECAMEYRRAPYSLSGMKESPLHVMAYFNSSTANLDVQIEVYGVGVFGMYTIITPGPPYVVDFPMFHELYSETLVDSIPGNKLANNVVYTVPFDTSRVDFIMYSDPGKLESSWNKVKNLRLVYEYRKKFPDSKIAFLHVEKQNGEEKSYFFMNKYKP